MSGKRSDEEKEVSELLKGIAEKNGDDGLMNKITDYGDMFATEIKMTTNKVLNIKEISGPSIQKELIAIKNKHFMLYSSIENLMTQVLLEAGAGLSDAKYIDAINNLFKTASMLLSKVSGINLEIVSKMQFMTEQEKKKGNKEDDADKAVKITYEDLVQSMRDVEQEEKDK